MNKIISDFINEAAIKYEKEVGASEIRVYYDRAMEIFAELIVKECIIVCVEKMPDSVPDYDCELRRNTVFAIDFVKERIKNHFGINDEQQ